MGHAAEVGLVHDAPHEFRLVADGETEAAARDEAHARVVAVAAGVAAGELADLGEGAEVEPGLVAVHREDAEETAEVGLGRHARLEGESRVAPVVMVEGQGYVLPGEEDVVQQDDDGMRTTVRPPDSESTRRSSTWAADPTSPTLPR